MNVCKQQCVMASQKRLFHTDIAGIFWLLLFEQLIRWYNIGCDSGDEISFDDRDLYSSSQVLYNENYNHYTIKLLDMWKSKIHVN